MSSCQSQSSRLSNASARKTKRMMHQRFLQNPKTVGAVVAVQGMRLKIPGLSVQTSEKLLLDQLPTTTIAHQGVDVVRHLASLSRVQTACLCTIRLAITHLLQLPKMLRRSQKVLRQNPDLRALTGPVHNQVLPPLHVPRAKTRKNPQTLEINPAHLSLHRLLLAAFQMTQIGCLAHDRLRRFKAQRTSQTHINIKPTRHLFPKSHHNMQSNFRDPVEQSLHLNSCHETTICNLRIRPGWKYAIWSQVGYGGLCLPKRRK